VNLSSYNEFIAQKPDRMNAMFYALEVDDWNVARPRPSMEEEFAHLFQSARENILRTVNCIASKELPDPWFAPQEFNDLSSMLYRVAHWALRPDDAAACQATYAFIGQPANCHAYAGQRFDILTTTVNKKYQLGLPMAFFDWAKWELTTEYDAIADGLAEAVHQAGIVETLFDDDVGILWVLALPPIPRTMGHFFAESFVPQAMDGFTDFLKFLFEKGADGEKRVRNPPPPAQILRDNLSPQLLLPPVQERVAHSPMLYGLPLETSNSASFSSPYYFASQLKVTIQRDLLNGKFAFGYFARFKNFIQISGTANSVMLFPIEGIRVLVEFPFAVTVIFNDQSLRYDTTGIVMRTQPQVVMITSAGCLVLPNMVLMADGTVGRCVNEVWTYVRPDSSVLRKVGLQQVESVAALSGQLLDVASAATTMVRPDNIALAVKWDGTRIFHLTDHVSVEQGDTTLYDIADFPITVLSAGKFTITIDRFEIYCQGTTLDIRCDDYQVNVDAERVRFTNPDAEMCLSEGRCEFRSAEQVLVADDKGLEKMVQIGVEIPAKKKIEIFETC
jgi:hypothetical protein